MPLIGDTRSAGNCGWQLQEEEFAYPEGFTTLEITTTKYLNLLTF